MPLATRGYSATSGSAQLYKNGISGSISLPTVLDSKNTPTDTARVCICYKGDASSVVGASNTIMPQQSARQKLLTALREAQQALGIQVHLGILQAAIQEVNNDDNTDYQTESVHSSHDGLSSNVEMSSLSSHSTSESEVNSGDLTSGSDSDSDGSMWEALSDLGHLADFHRLTTALHDEVEKAR